MIPSCDGSDADLGSEDQPRGHAREKNSPGANGRVHGNVFARFAETQLSGGRVVEQNPSSSANRTLPRDVRLFGIDHSPWVQAVLLGLHDRGVPYESSVAPSPSLFLSSGVFMPAARIDGSPWTYDSARILQALGYSEVEPADAKAMVRLFSAGAFERTSSAVRFWTAFSSVRDGSPSALERGIHQLARPVVVLTFFLLISLARLRGTGPSDAQKLAALEYWNAQLTDGRAFLGGPGPDTADLQLFGQVQMLTSIPGPTLNILLEAPELPALRAWAKRMQARFADYPHLYSGPVFEPAQPAPQAGSIAQRAAFWTGCAAAALFFPLALMLSAYSIVRVGRSGLRSRG